MTITITKTRLALAVLAVTLLATSTAALATHVFDDVPDDKFYAGPVEWAADNEITTGRSPTMFAPEDEVTRGESVTFLKRYHDNLAQPGIESAQSAADAAQADADANASDIAALEAAKPFAVTARTESLSGLSGTAAVVTTFDVTPGADGSLVVNSSVTVFESTEDQGVECSISTTGAFDDDYRQKWVSPGTDPNVAAQISGTRLVEIGSGETATIDLVCRQTGGGTANLFDAVLTGVFVADA